VPDNPIQIADAALYLSKTQPSLGITDPYELTADQLDAAVAKLVDPCRDVVAGDGGHAQAVAAPVLSDPRFNGRPLYSSEVVVRTGSPFRSFADLEGSRWAVNEASSWSGYWVVLQRVGSWNYFGEVVETGFHRRSLRLVAAGGCPPRPMAG